VTRAITRFLDVEKHSWSLAEQSVQDPQQRDLLLQRPWLPHYDENVPQSITLPRAALPELLSATARRFPLKPAIIHAGRRITYRTLNRQANRFANALSKAGVKSGERVLLALPNLPQTIIAYYGTLKCGAVAALALPDAGAQTLAAMLDDTEAHLLVVETSMLPTAAAALRQRTNQAATIPVVVVDPAEYLTITGRLRRRLKPSGAKSMVPSPADGAAFLPFRDFIKDANPENPPVFLQPKSLAVIQYTQSPAGKPLGVMLSHRNLLANILQSRHWIPDAAEGDERILCAVPVLHSYGMTVGMNLSIALGGCLVLTHSSEAGHLLHTIQRYKPTIFPAVPQIFLAINDFPEVRKYGVDSIRLCISPTGRGAGNLRKTHPRPAYRGLRPDGSLAHHPYEPAKRHPQARQHRTAPAFHRSPPGRLAHRAETRTHRPDWRAGGAWPAGDDGLLERTTSDAESPFTGWLAADRRCRPNGQRWLFLDHRPQGGYVVPFPPG
jgi:long-chain acyl-CoA synthetase